MKRLSATDLIEKRIAEEDWKAARRLVEEELASKPRDHWLLARLALTYYEEKGYAKALRYARQAHEIAPDCPLVLWELAGALDMTADPKAALDYYGKIIAAHRNKTVTDPCWESPRWLLSLQVDATYRAALCLDDLGHAENALYFLRLYLRGLELDLDTIYGADAALQKIREITDRMGVTERFPPRKSEVRRKLHAV